MLSADRTKNVLGVRRAKRNDVCVCALEMATRTLAETQASNEACPTFPATCRAIRTNFDTGSC